MNLAVAAAAQGHETHEIQEELRGRVANAYKTDIANGIQLVVCPGVKMSWGDFCNLAPPYSVALDGIVVGPPVYDESGPRANFNHHEGVDRMSTRATCAQVAMALRMDMMKAFRQDGRPKMFVWVEDPDQDSSLAVKLLMLHERFLGNRSEPLLNKLVGIEDYIDTTAGACGFDPEMLMMQQLAWVFDPYVQARMEGRIPKMQGAEMANVIISIGHRIDQYLLGNSGTKVLDTRYEVIGGGSNWRMIKEIGFYARPQIFASGFDAFVSLLGNDNSKYHYSIGRRSPYIPNFPLGELYEVLNNLESLDNISPARWGGSNTIGGSPRRIGSSLTPQEIETALNTYLVRSNS